VPDSLSRMRYAPGCLAEGFRQSRRIIVPTVVMQPPDISSISATRIWLILPHQDLEIDVLRELCQVWMLPWVQRPVQRTA
jgi:hypothetical protein